jgi:hypothetical protein
MVAEFELNVSCKYVAVVDTPEPTGPTRAITNSWDNLSVIELAMTLLGRPESKSGADVPVIVDSKIPSWYYPQTR